MSRRTSQANKAIAAAWSNEQQLVREGKGTRDWTPEQQRDILDKGKAYDDNGKAFEGHHMKSAENFPEYQGDSGNIQFLTRAEHFSAHNRNFQNPTNGFFNPYTGETKDFGSNRYEPCEIIKLSNPMVHIGSNVEDVNESIEKSDNRVKKSDVISSHIKNKSNVSAKIKTAVPKAQKVAQMIKDKASEVVKFTVEHKEIIGAVAEGAIAIYAMRKSSSSDYSSSTDEDDEGITYEEENSEEDFEEDDFSDESLSEGPEKSSRASPRKHIVKPHGQRYGKNKVWKEKKSFQRGGDKSD
jgi:hypothetical protein